jgi:hypothetical protein
MRKLPGFRVPHRNSVQNLVSNVHFIHIPSQVIHVLTCLGVGIVVDGNTNNGGLGSSLVVVTVF